MDLGKIRKKLLELLAEKPRIEALHEPTPSNDEGDVANAAALKEGTAEQCERQRIVRMQAQVGLDRINDGTYGICLACDGEISPKRIMAVPWTPFCLECQTKLDQRELHGFEFFEAPGFSRTLGLDLQNFLGVSC